MKKVPLSESIKNFGGKALSAVGNTLFSAGMGMLVEGGLTLAVKSIGALWDEIAHKQENAIAKGDKALTQFKNTNQEVANSTQWVALNGERFEQLSKGISSSGVNLSLTSDEFAEYQSLANEASQLMPDLVTGYTGLGVPILGAARNVSDLNLALKNQKVEKYSSAMKNATAVIEKFQAEVDETKWMPWEESGLGAQKEQLDKFKKLYNSKDPNKNLTNSSVMKELLENQDFKTLLEENGLYEKLNAVYLETYKNSLSGKKGFSKESKQTLLDVEKLSGTLNAMIEQKASDVKQILPAAFGQLESYQDLIQSTPQLENQISALYNSLNAQDIVDLGFTSGTPSEAKDKITTWAKDVTDAFKNKDAQNALDDLFTLSIPDEDMSFKDWSSNVSKAVNKVDKLTHGLIGKENFLEASGIDSIQDEGERAITAIENRWSGFADKARDLNINEILELSSLAKNDFSIGSFDDALIKVRDIIDSEKYSLKSMQDTITSAKAASSVYSSALNEATSTGGLSSDGITSLTSAFDKLEDTDLSSLFVNTSDGVKLNIDALKQFSEQQNEIISNDFVKGIELQNKAIAEQEKKLSSLTEGTDEYETAQKDLKDLEEELASKLQGSAQWNAIKKQQQELLSDYSAWTRATSSANAGDQYVNMVSGLKAAKDAFDKGLVGTDDFKTFAALISPTGSYDPANFADNYAKAARYLTEDKSGVTNFLNDLSSLTDSTGNKLATFLGTNAAGFEEWSFNMSDADDAAQKLGISTEFLMQNFQRARDYGIDNNFISSVEDGRLRVSDLSKQLADAYKDLERYQQEGQYTTVDENGKTHKTFGEQQAIDSKKAEIATLERNIQETTANMSVLASQGVENTKAQVQGAYKAIDVLQKEGQKILSDESLTAAQKKAVLATYNDEIQKIADENHIELTADMKIDDAEYQKELLKTEKKNQEYLEAQKSATISTPAQRTYGDPEEQKEYDNILSGLQEKYQDQTSGVQGLTEALKGLNSEQLKSINYSDGQFDDAFEGAQNAEKAIDGLLTALGKGPESAELLIDALEACGLVEVTPKVDDSEISSSINELKELQEQGKISSTIDLDFDVDTMSIDEIDSKVNELKQEKIRLETEGDTSGIEAIETIIDSLENRSIDLKIQAQIDKGVSYESLLNMSDEQLSKTLQIDSSQVDEARAKLEELSQITTEAPVTVKIDEAQLSTLTEGTKNVTVTAKAEGKEEVDALQDSIDNVHGKVVPVKANVFGTDEVNELSEAIERVNGRIVSVGANVFGTNEVWGLASAISMVQSKTVTVTTNYVTNGSASGKAAGTMLSPTHSSGTAYNVLNTLPAHASGKVSLEKDETALVNELGTESIIRDGVWKLIPGKMHTENLKKGDIILNAKQTEDLLRHGKTNSHARAYASGTLSTGKILSKAYASGSVTDEVDKMVDWFERLVAKLEDRVTLYEKKSDNAVGLHSQLRYLEKAQKTNEELIKHYKEAQKKYKGQASSVAKELGLSDSLRKKVENGSVNFEKLSDDDKKRVDAYSKWYDKIRDCTSAIEDLNAAQKDLINKQLDKVVQKYDNILGTYKGNVDVLEAQKEYRKAAGYSEAPHSDYYGFVKKQMNLQNKQTAIIESEIEAYKKQMGKIKNKKSPEYKQAVAQLKELEVSLYESKTAAIEFRNEMYELQLQMKQWQVDKFNRAFDKQTARLDYLKATNYKDAAGATEKDISEIIKTNDRRVKAIEDKRNEISKMMLAYGTNSTKYRELAEQLAECDEEILNIAADTAQWRKEILALRFEPFYKAQDALDEVIQDYEIIRGMMDSESFFNDDGSYSEYGMANIALLQESTEAEKQKIANYKKQLENIQKLYDNGSMTKEDYESYTKEILDGIRNSSQALSNYNKEILDMYEQQITKENELLQTNINKRQEALDAKENYYNYDKTIKKKSKDINALKAQIAALEGTNLLIPIYLIAGTSLGFYKLQYKNETCLSMNA